MNMLIATAILQAALLFAIPSSGEQFSPNLQQNELDTLKAADEASRDPTGSGNRSGRVLALYGLNIQQNTVAAVSQLERVASTVGNASVQIESLLTSLSTSDAQILSAVSAIDTSLAASGAIATKLDTISTSLGSILTAVTDSTTPGTLLNQLSSLYTLLDTKLSNFEQIFGYDDYPPAPSSRLGRQGKARVARILSL